MQNYNENVSSDNKKLFFENQNYLYLDNVTPNQIDELFKEKYIKVNDIFLGYQKPRILYHMNKFYRNFRSSNNHLFITIDAIRFVHGKFRPVIFIPVYLYYYKNTFYLKKLGNAFINDAILSEIGEAETTKLRSIKPVDAVSCDIISSQLGSLAKGELLHENYFYLDEFKQDKLILNHEKFQKDNKIGLFSSKELELLEIEKRNNILYSNHDQRIAIELAFSGESFAIDGESGTGKTQTIINIISNLLIKNKRVLYVNDDMLANREFHEKLDKLGLTNFVLKLNRTADDIVDQIIEKEYGKYRNIDIQTENVFNIRKFIKRYEKFMHKRIKGFKLVEVIDTLFNLDVENGLELSKYEINNIRKQDYSSIKDTLDRCSNIINKIGKPKDSVWINLNTSIIKTDLINSVKNLLQNLLKDTTEIVDQIEEMNHAYGLVLETNSNSIRNGIKHLRGINIETYPSNWLSLTNNSFYEAQKHYKQYFSMFEERDITKDDIDQNFELEFYKIDLEKFLLFIKKDYFNFVSFDDLDKYEFHINQLEINFRKLLKIEQDLKSKEVIGIEFNSKTYVSMFEVYHFITENEFVSKKWLNIDKKIIKKAKEYQKVLDAFKNDYSKLEAYFETDIVLDSNFINSVEILLSNHSRKSRNTQEYKIALAHIIENCKDNTIIKPTRKLNAILNNIIELSGYKSKISKIDKFIKDYLDISCQNISQLRSVIESFLTFKELKFDDINTAGLSYLIFEKGLDKARLFVQSFKRILSIMNNIDFKNERVISDIYNFKQGCSTIGIQKESVELVKEFKHYYKKNSEFNKKDFFYYIKELKAYYKLDQKLEQNSNQLYILYGLTSDDSSLDMLTVYEKLNKFSELITLFDSLENLINQLVDSITFDNISKKIQTLRTLYYKLSNQYRTYNNLFYNGSSHLIDSDMKDNIHTYREFIENFDIVEDWYDFTNHLKMLRNFEQDTIIKLLWNGIIQDLTNKYSYSYFTALYAEFLEHQPVDLSLIEEQLSNVNLHYHLLYEKNTETLIKSLGVNSFIYSTILRNIKRKNIKYKKAVNTAMQLFKLFTTDSDTLLGYLNTESFDTIIVDDVELIRADKLANIMGAKQIILVGNSHLSEYSTNNILFRIRESNKILLTHNYSIKMLSISNFERKYFNKFYNCIELCDFDKSTVSIVDSLNSISKFLYRLIISNPKASINIFVAGQKAKDQLGYELFISMIENITYDDIQKLWGNIRIVNIYKENCKYCDISVIDIVSLYHNDKYKIESIPKYIRTMINVKQKVYIYDNENIVKNRNEAPIIKPLLELAKLEKGARMNMLEYNKIKTAEKFIYMMKKYGQNVILGNSDIELFYKHDECLNGIKIYDILSQSDINYINQKRKVDIYLSNGFNVKEFFMHKIITDKESFIKHIGGFNNNEKRE